MATAGEAITRTQDGLHVPDRPIVPFIEGDGTGRDIWRASQRVFDAAVEKAYGGRRKIDIYRRIYSGINGTPMPGFYEKYAEEPEKIWYLVHFITSITEGREFEVVEGEETAAEATAAIGSLDDQRLAASRGAAATE